jgi:cytochrome c
MRPEPRARDTLAIVASAVLLSFSASAFAQDDTAVRSLLKKSNCMKCHAETRSREGPSFQRIAEKYRGKSDAEALLTRYVSTVVRIRDRDGIEDDHEPLKTNDPAEIRAVVRWILARQ